MIRVVFIAALSLIGCALLVTTLVLAPYAGADTAGPAVVAGGVGALLALGMAAALVMSSREGRDREVRNGRDRFP